MARGEQPVALTGEAREDEILGIGAEVVEHGDHVGGKEAFAETGTLVVAHDNVRTRLSSDQVMAAFEAPEDLERFTRTQVLELDQWIRRRVRMCFWKTWKQPGTRRRSGTGSTSTWRGRGRRRPGRGGTRR